MRADDRYTRGRVVSSVKRPIIGTPDEHKISTSYSDRVNNTLRQQFSKRFVRLTLAYSKRVANMEAAVHLGVAYYNLCRIHDTLRTTPAMAADVTATVWSVGDLLDAALASLSDPPTGSPPGPPGPPPPPRPQLPPALTARALPGRVVDRGGRAFRVLDGGRGVA